MEPQKDKLFQGEEASKIIGSFAKDKLLPAVNDLEKFAISVADHKVTFINSFYRKKLTKLDREHRSKNKNFLALYHFYSTPDELFKEVKSPNASQFSERDGKMIADYFNFQQAMMNSFGEGFKLLEMIDRQLNRYFQSVDQRVATILSILAITISIIATIWHY